ncbi:MAG TPA: apolipoprotein N-acyltransferase [Polyangiaceae bacterium]|nr:apolipoprotein N-acyltransferase [Polyangiaceae bacterium]
MNDSAPLDAAPRVPGPLGTAPLVTGKTAALLALCCGVLYFLAFPGIDVWPLGFVAFVPLCVALYNRTAKQALWLGWIAGFTMTFTGFYWLLGMLRTFSGFPTIVCLLFMALLSGYQAGRIALMTWLFARGVSKGWPRFVCFALAFITSEHLYPLLFPWYFGATVHQVPALTQIAEFGNPIVVGLTLLCSNWAISELLIAYLQKRPLLWKKAVPFAAVPLLSAAYGALRVSQIDQQVSQEEKLRVGVVQANMSLFDKRNDREQGLHRHLRLTRELQKEKPLDLVVWSETSVAGAISEDEVDGFYRELFTAKLKTPTVFGGLLVRPVDDERSYVLFNSALLSDQNGNIVGRYDKQYLLAFGEYLPFGDSFPILYKWSPNTGRFSKGTSFAPLALGNHLLSVHICYEDVLPSFVNRLVDEKTPDVLINITNDAWFGDSTEPWIHLALASFRAIEHRRFFVRSTNSGVSAIIDPAGRIQEHTGTFRQQAISGEITMRRPTKTPYELYGDLPWWLSALSSAFFAFSGPRGKKSALKAAA